MIEYIAFVDDDPGYHSWLAANQAGFVLNTPKKQRSLARSMMHEASCRHARDYRPGSARSYTGKAMMKLCSLDPLPLLEYAENIAGTRPSCPHCGAP